MTNDNKISVNLFDFLVSSVNDVTALYALKIYSREEIAQGHRKKVDFHLVHANDGEEEKK
ncbi:hypothetical protein JCM9140_1588 [Halalkalibacter wakoensis JCM 9140]|uniref:Uncharacterized protein n=1 Tax=Halalkalibacter wakoensis JCM 9140 TaxID=1236970 RepID=W4Q0I2_9BACI|nr:hypothetical protein JCM9140_1588 [Halalkalibacter wakoensis JCM 9140]